MTIESDITGRTFLLTLKEKISFQVLVCARLLLAKFPTDVSVGIGVTVL